MVGKDMCEREMLRERDVERERSETMSRRYERAMCEGEMCERDVCERDA